ncbi:MAG: serine--tRNA ligase, partial [Alphaproteobacteria bacterium]|nr:serine--tRNA ligase [Alphaproteobacteria bacterium]
MHDIKAIRDNPEAFDRGLARRGLAPMSLEILGIDARRRQNIVAIESLQQSSNTFSAGIATAVRTKDLAKVEELKSKSAAVKEQIRQLKDSQQLSERSVDEELRALLAAIPNIPFDDVPDGKDETGNVEMRR